MREKEYKREIPDKCVKEIHFSTYESYPICPYLSLGKRECTLNACIKNSHPIRRNEK